MKIKVKESCIIRPSQETPIERQCLSNIDLLHGIKHSVPSIYLYKPDGSSNFFDSTVLKEALGKLLVAFYPVAGRFGVDENGVIEINCNGEGVLFQEAETDSEVEQLGDFVPIEKIKQLIPPVDFSTPDFFSNPLFVAQVTRFKCGGVCLGMQIHHMIGDGFGALYFINSWADVARGLPIAVQPILDRTILRGRTPSRPAFPHPEYAPYPTLQTQTKNNTAQARFDITPDQISTLKAKARGTDTQTSYTTYETLVGHIWKCASKARRLPDDQITELNMMVDGRSRLNPPIPAGYFGNVGFRAMATASCGELLSEPLSRTVDRVHKEIKRRDNEYMRSAIDHLELNRDRIPQLNRPERSPNMRINSWTRMPFEKADFGWGKPWSIRAMSPSEGKGQIMGRAGEDGGLWVVLCLEEEAMKLFKNLFYDFTRTLNEPSLNKKE